MKVYKGARVLHKWMAAIVGIQVLLWISGGVVMSVIPIDIVRGQHLLVPIPESPNVGTLPKVNAALSLSQWQSLRWVNAGSHWVVQGTNLQGESHWLNPHTGRAAEVLHPEQIRELARQSYAGDGDVLAVQLLDTLPSHVSHLQAPLYAVDFDDWIQTRFYLQPETGQVRSVRSDIWHLYDFFWMLHIMDYQHREDFNNPLLITASLTALLFSAMGFVLLYQVALRSKRMKFLRFARRAASSTAE